MPDADPKTQAERPRDALNAAARETRPPDIQATVPPSGTAKPDAKSADLPENFGRYRILKLLGQGGMGSVFLAQDTQLERQVALKVPKFEASDGPQVLERFFREARAAATLHHPNICPIHDVGAIDGTHYLTMAYIEGKPLTDFIRADKGLPAAQATALVRKIALALDEAHRHGIVHRDLKPANIMINQRKEPVIMDFGLARQTSKEEARITKSGAVVGTPAYMSPEQVTAKEVGPASDIYSLGVILYEMLTGKLPFDGPMMAVLSQILLDDPPPPSKHHPGLDPKLEAICLKALAKDPGKRQASMAELAAALGQILRAPAPAGAAAPATESVAPPTSALKQTGTIKAPAHATAEETPVETVAVVPAKKRKAKAKTQPLHLRPWPWIAAAAVIVGAIGIWLLAGVVFRVQTKNGVVELHINEPGAQVFVDEELKITLTSPSDKEPIRIEVPEGKHTMKVVKGGFVTETQEFTLRAGTPREIRVILRPDPLAAATKGDPLPIKEKEIDPSTGKGWTSLFNGKDLAGWKKTGVQSGWSVENGELVAEAVEQGRNIGWLMTEKDYADFELQLEFMIAAGTDSGVAFRCDVTETSGAGQAEIQIVDEQDAELVRVLDQQPHRRTGALAGQSSLRKLATLERDVWHRLTIELRGRQLKAMVDGTVTVDTNLDEHIDVGKKMNRRGIWQPSGPIGLQKFKGSIRFRNIRVKELPTPAEQGFVPLFNGKDLTGWTAHPGAPGDWKVENGNLVGRGPQFSHLFTERNDFADFHFLVEAKINASGNSGQVFRAQEVAQEVKVGVPLGYEAQIRDNETGSLYVPAGKGKPLARIFVQEVSVPQDTWFTQEVIAKGNHIVIKVNGVVTADYVDKSNTYQRGRLALQVYSKPTVVHFRHVKVKELKALEKAGDGWAPLFNGKDLTGWKTHPDQPGGWTVEDAMLVGRAPPVKGKQHSLTHLFTERVDFENFHLRAEAKVNKDGNSGIYFRSDFGVNRFGMFPDGYEAQICHSYDTPTWLTGSLTRFSEKAEKTSLRPDEWFNMELIAQGNHLVIKVNDKITADYIDEKATYRKGRIALQAWSEAKAASNTVVHFRKVEVKESNLAKQASDVTGNQKTPVVKPVAPLEVRNLQELNTNDNEFHTWLSEDGLTIYWAIWPGPNDWIWTATRKTPKFAFQDKTRLFRGHSPVVSVDGTEMIFGNPEPSQFMTTTRTSLKKGFSTPTAIREFVIGEKETWAPRWLSSDALTLYLEKNGPDKWISDIWVTTRATKTSPWKTPQLAEVTVKGRMRLSQPSLTNDERHMFVTVLKEESPNEVRIGVLERDERTKPFSRLEYLDLRDAIGPLPNCFMPRYVPATRELFLSSRFLFRSEEQMKQRRSDLWVANGFVFKNTTQKE